MFRFGNDAHYQAEGYTQFEDQLLIIKSIQWQKDSHGLFDYEMRQITKSNFKVDSSKMFLRNNETLSCVDLECNIKKEFND